MTIKYTILEDPPAVQKRECNCEHCEWVRSQAELSARDENYKRVVVEDVPLPPVLPQRSFPTAID